MFPIQESEATPLCPNGMHTQSSRSLRQSLGSFIVGLKQILAVGLDHIGPGTSSCPSQF